MRSPLSNQIIPKHLADDSFQNSRLLRPSDGMYGMLAKATQPKNHALGTVPSNATMPLDQFNLIESRKNRWQRESSTRKPDGNGIINHHLLLEPSSSN